MEREITIVVTDEEARRIDESVAMGAFESPADFVHAALAQFDMTSEDFPFPADTTRRMIDEAIADPRPAIPAKQVFANLRARIQAQANAKVRG